MSFGAESKITEADVLAELDTHRSIPDLLAKEAATILKITRALRAALMNGKRVYLCGNGGSAADAQHIAAEMIGRYKRERKGFPFISLTTDTSILTAWANDYQYETVFSRQIESLGNPGDILWALSTSGNSPNILKAAEAARSLKMQIVSMTGHQGGKLKGLSDLNLNIASSATARIQEGHMLAYHTICELLDRELA